MRTQICRVAVIHAQLDETVCIKEKDVPDSLLSSSSQKSQRYARTGTPLVMKCAFAQSMSRSQHLSILRCSLFCILAKFHFADFA
ncbi:MAG: hypothetical protein VX930_12710, partial [Pseudomonadota bacterium]|nr:hypothetical protein [Pseudomonadota bacterium]